MYPWRKELESGLFPKVLQIFCAVSNERIMRNNIKAGSSCNNMLISPQTKIISVSKILESLLYIVTVQFIVE